MSVENENVCENLVFFVNGKKVEDEQVNPEWTLLHYLRNKLHLFGTKDGCSEGGCGTCTVMVSKFDRENKQEVHLAINACLAPICSLHGLAITTIEGIGSTKTKLHPIQQKLAKEHPSQCGFCTPGMVMAMYSMLRQNPKPEWKHLSEAFQGNLCRCSGYRPIIEGLRSYADDLNKGVDPCPMGDQCCKNKLDEENILGDSKVDDLSHTILTPGLDSQEVIFPPELKLMDTYDKQYLKIKGPIVTWYRPTALDQLLDLKFRDKSIKIVSGNTITIFETKFGGQFYPIIVHPASIPEMTQIFKTNEGIRIGASSTLEQIRAFLRNVIAEYPEEKTRLFKVLTEEVFHWFGCKQVRNVCTLGGNVMTSVSTCDILPILMVSGVKLEVHHKENGKRFIPFDNNFITGNKKNIVDPEEVLVAIHLPFSSKNEYFQAYKQSRRREVDPTIINFAVMVEFENDRNIISKIRFAIGNVSFKPVEAPETEAKLKGLPWTKSTLEVAYPLLLKDIHTLESTSPGGMVEYRKSLVLSLFLRAFLAISKDLYHNIGLKLEEYIENQEISGICKYREKDYNGLQQFKGKKYSNKEISLGLKKTSGESIFVDDNAKIENELFLAYIFSTEAYANIDSINWTEALELEGVHGQFGVDMNEDLNQTVSFNRASKLVLDNKNVSYNGQIIGAILAEDRFIAEKAVKKVTIEYKTLEPVTISIEDAIKHNSFFNEHTCEVSSGNIEEMIQKAEHIIRDSCKIANQKYFYIEPQGTLAIPNKNDGSMDIYSSTEWPSMLQKRAADLLKIPENKIRIHADNIGGAHGGKKWKSISVALPVILAAHKYQRPVRCIIERNEDMVISGGRISHLFNYTVGFQASGKIIACDFDIFLNCGHSQEVKQQHVDNCLNHLTGAFNISSIKGKAKLCKTNLPSNTYMTGYGGTEGQFPIICAIEKVAEYLKKDPIEVTLLNMFSDNAEQGDTMNCSLEKCWEDCLKKSDYYKRRELATQFNSKNRFKKRGLSVVPTKFILAQDDNIQPELKQNEKYFLYGAACTEVEVDALTGDHQVLRTDIVLDLGKNLNTIVNIDQIEGAFLQGYGLFIMEETLYSPSGRLLTSGPGMYKIPNVNDAPGEFNVTLLEERTGPAEVSLKKYALQEPVVFLASSVYFAIKDAIKAVKRDHGASTDFHLDTPATCERIRMTCDDDIIQMLSRDENINYWSVAP